MHTLLAFFILSLPFFSLLSHTRLFLAVMTLILLYITLKNRGCTGIEEKGSCLYILFLTTVLAGAFKSGATQDSLLFFTLALGGFLPLLYPKANRTVSLALSLSGGICGAFACLEYLSGKALALWSDTERFGTLTRAGGFFGNPNILGAFLSVCVIFSFDELCRALKRGNWSIFALSLLFSGFGLLFSYSRGAWLGTLLGFLFYLWRRFSLTKRKENFSFCFIPFFTSLISRALSVFSPDSSMSYRFSLWKSIFSLPFSSLLFGSGEGKRALLSLLTPTLAAGLEKIEHTHSLYLHIVCAEGIFGLAFFLLFLFYRLRKRKKETAAHCGALVSLLLYGIFDDPLYSGQIGVLFWILANVN